MGDDKRSVWGELQDALEEWAVGRDAAEVEAVTRVIWVNWERERVCNFLDGGKVDGARAYVERLAERYERWSDYVRALQEAKEREAWEEALEKFQRWSYHLLGRLDFPSNAIRYRESVDVATDAAAEMLEAHFPYDVDFDPWAYVLVRNICYRHMRDRLNGSQVPEEQLVNLEAWDGWLRNLADEGAEAPNAEARIYEREEKAARERERERLMAAVEGLPPSEKEFILLYYFEGLTFGEIAERTGKSANALYQHHFRALNRLRDALDGDDASSSM